ncbi:MAG: hypothetical protein U0795_07270 [Pirellulales bacterium]
MKPTDLIRNLMIMAAIDGKFTQPELEYLGERARLWGISPDEFKTQISAAVRPEADFTIPPTMGERLEVLSEMIQVMAADGNLDEIEKKFLASATIGMHVTLEQLNQLIDDLVKS